MTKPYQVVRLFSTSDAKMLEFARLIHGFFLTDLADFTAFDPDFDPVYAAAFLASIVAAESFSSDDQLIDVMATATVEVEENMKACRDYFQSSKYFIEKAYPKKPTVWNEFGYNDYMESRQVQAKMIQFMLHFHETATKYSAELIAVNFDAAKIAEIKSLADALQAANFVQETIRKERTTKTQNRVTLLNECWENCQTIRKAAKAVYAENWGKWQLYLLPWGGEGEAPAPTEEITGEVPYGMSVNIPVPDLLPESVLTLTNTGDVILKFYGCENQDDPCGDAGLLMNPDDSQAVTLQDIAPEGIVPAYLNVCNTIAPPGSPDGEYSVIKVS
jgi:hypothetical protein